MSTTLLVDEHNDLVINADGQLLIVDGMQAVLLLAKHYAQTIRDEMLLNQGEGVRYFATGFNTPRLALFEHDFRERVMQLDGVVAITHFDARVSGEDIRYNATIETIYGIGEINNG